MQIDIRKIAQAVGLICWGAKPGLGSDLTLEMGQPHLRVRRKLANPTGSERVQALLRRNRVFIEGDYHLWLQECRWRLLDGNTEVCSEQSFSEEGIGSAIDGYYLSSASVESNRLRLTFDGGTQLIAECDGGDLNDCFSLFLADAAEE